MSHPNLRFLFRTDSLLTKNPMWYQHLPFYRREEGLQTVPPAYYFSSPLTALEVERYAEFLDIARCPVPAELYLPAEMLQLLQYSDGGVILNGDREFGFFSLSGIRETYFAYGFPKWAPLFLPVALNRGGRFCAFDCRAGAKGQVVGVPAGDLGYESAVVLGCSLETVLSKGTDVEEVL